MGARRPSPPERGPARVGRWFLALRPPTAQAQALAEVGERLAVLAGGRALAAPDLHVTLAFVGACAPQHVPLLIDALRRPVLAEPAALAITELGSFDGRLLWAGPSITPPWLLDCAEAVRS